MPIAYDMVNPIHTDSCEFLYLFPNKLTCELYQEIDGRVTVK